MDHVIDTPTGEIDPKEPHWNESCNGLVQDCSISNALAMEILQSWTKPSILIAHVRIKQLRHLSRLSEIGKIYTIYLFPRWSILYYQYKSKITLCNSKGQHNIFG